MDTNSVRLCERGLSRFSALFINTVSDNQRMVCGAGWRDCRSANLLTRFTFCLVMLWDWAGITGHSGPTEFGVNMPLQLLWDRNSWLYYFGSLIFLQLIFFPPLLTCLLWEHCHLGRGKVCLQQGVSSIIVASLGPLAMTLGFCLWKHEVYGHQSSTGTTTKLHRYDWLSLGVMGYDLSCSSDVQSHTSVKGA